VSLLDVAAILPWALMAGGCGIGYALVRQGNRMVERLGVLEEALESVQDDLLVSRMESLVSLPAGAEAPAFELPDLQGRRVSLEQFRGTRALLIFFSPTCPFCREMAPGLARLPVDGLDGRPIPIVVTEGDPEANRALISEHGIRCPVLLDPDKKVSALYHPEGTPAAYLIDEWGLIAKERADSGQAVLNLAALPVTHPTAEPTSTTAEVGAESSGGGKASREVRVPIRGIPQDGIGVGDLVKRMTDAMGIKACRGCERRRQVLNRWVIKGSRPVIKSSDRTMGGGGGGGRRS
jgi:peroxiredoxin